MRPDGLHLSVDLDTDEFEAALAENLSSLAVHPEQRNVKSEIVCLGESHGSHLFALTQEVLPGTGGLLINLSKELGLKILLDPGWGTLAAARRQGIILNDLDLILLSHCHLDHVGDLNAILVTSSLFSNMPIVVGNSTALNGSLGQPPILSDYFRKLCHQVIVADSEKLLTLRDVEIFPFSTQHRENVESTGKALSYIITLPRYRGLRIGLITDGPLGHLSGPVMTALRRCDLLVVNIGTCSTQPDAPSHSKVYDNALCFHGLRRFIDEFRLAECATKVLCITHLGAELMEVRSPLMKRFLSQSAFTSPVDLIEPSVQQMVNESGGTNIRVKVLREGDFLEV